MVFRAILCLALCLVAARTLNAEEPTRNTVIYDGKLTRVIASPVESNDLWITLADLRRSTGFVVKPQGVCRDELCFPIPKSRKQQFIERRGRTTWFNLSEFARLVRQPAARNRKNAVWYFGLRSDVQNEFLRMLEAPDFTLPDLEGRMHSLSDFRGKKVLLVTWASW
jgi:hypothetical protein